MKPFDESRWPINQAIKTVIGDGRAHFALFADPNCPWCRRFEQETITKLDNVTIYTFLCPILGEDSVMKSAMILSAKNPEQALKDWMLRGELPEVAPTEENLKIARENATLYEDKLGGETVPGEFMADGKGPFGFMMPADFVVHLEGKRPYPSEPTPEPGAACTWQP